MKLVEARGLADMYVRLPRSRKLRRLSRIIASLRLAAWVIRHRHHLNAIHANATTGLYLALPAVLLTRVLIVVWVHDPISSPWGRRLGPILRPLVRNVQWTAVSSTARQVVVSTGLCRPQDVEIVPNPVDPFEVLADEEPTRSGDSLTIGYLTGTTYRKGFDLLPAVIDRLTDLRIEWRLFITPRRAVFDDHVWEALERLPKARISVPGRDPDVRQVYRQCDVVFVPSREESFSLVTAEAMLNQIPVVASDIPAIRGLLGDNEAGLLFPRGDVEAAAAALRRLALDADLRASLGKAGRQRAARYRPSAIAQMMLGKYGLATPRSVKAPS